MPVAPDPWQGSERARAGSTRPVVGERESSCQKHLTRGRGARLLRVQGPRLSTAQGPRLLLVQGPRLLLVQGPRLLLVQGRCSCVVAPGPRQGELCVVALNIVAHVTVPSARTSVSVSKSD